MKKSFWVKFSVFISIIVLILTLDLVTKYIFDAQLTDGSVISVIPGLFNFQLVHNYGASWGILAGKQVFLIAISIIFLALFVVYYIKEPKKTWLFNIAFALLFAGCIGNLYDRIVFGYVRDFIQFDFWKSFPVFNFADVALCVGVVLFFIYLIVMFVKSKKGEKSQNSKEDEKHE